ncbi:MAG: hypothetical protein AAGG38_07330 [Planctomycetota bacterium]
MNTITITCPPHPDLTKGITLITEAIAGEVRNVVANKPTSSATYTIASPLIPDDMDGKDVDFLISDTSLAVSFEPPTSRIEQLKAAAMDATEAMGGRVEAVNPNHGAEDAVNTIIELAASIGGTVETAKEPTGLEGEYPTFEPGNLYIRIPEAVMETRGEGASDC